MTMSKPKPVRKYLLPLKGSELKSAIPHLHIKVVVFENGGGTIETNLKQLSRQKDSMEQLSQAAFNMQMDAVESMLLALACAGVDLDSPEFMKGLANSLEAISNHD